MYFIITISCLCSSSRLLGFFSIWICEWETEKQSRSGQIRKKRRKKVIGVRINPIEFVSMICRFVGVDCDPYQLSNYRVIGLSSLRLVTYRVIDLSSYRVSTYRVIDLSSYRAAKISFPSRLRVCLHYSSRSVICSYEQVVNVRVLVGVDLFTQS